MYVSDDFSKSFMPRGSCTFQLSFASGSLAMYLNITYSARLPASTVDDIEGTLYKFIPSGVVTSCHRLQ